MQPLLHSRREFLKHTLGAAAIAASLPLLAACSSTPTSTSAPAAPPAATAAPAAAATSAPAAAAPTTAPAQVAAQPSSINMMMNGGLYQEVATRVVLDPFSKAHNVTINVIPANSAPMLTRVKAEASAPTLDAVVWDDPVAVQARDAGLVEKIDAANVPNMKDLAAWADYKDGFGPSIHSNPSMWAYNTDNFKLDPPQSYKDIWNSTYQKALDLPSVDVTQGIQFLVLSAMLFGGGYDNIEPGFTALQQLQPNVGAYYHDVSEIAPTLQNDPYIMLTGNGQIHNVLGQGYPLKIVVPSEGAMATPAVFDIIKGSKAKGLLEQLLNSYLDPANQLEIAKAQYWAVPNTKVVIPDQFKNDIPAKVITFDPRAIAAHQQEWATRAKREFGG
ncbi:MAG TPA: extracellular solute-binding protein [Chloroflexota bacterium]|jgi:putative spermidine/putrescine transport system substrate-binding protein